MFRVNRSHSKFFYYLGKGSRQDGNNFIYLSVNLLIFMFFSFFTAENFSYGSKLSGRDVTNDNGVPPKFYSTLLEGSLH